MNELIQPSERLAIMGMTGSGKTVFAKKLLTLPARSLVIDPKHTFRLDGYTVGRSLPMWSKNFRVIYRPRPSDDARLAALCYEIYRRKNAVIYIDELATVAESYPITRAVLEDISRTGREICVSVWSAMQRPRWVPRSFLTESEVLAVFYLRDKQDRQHAAGLGGDEIMTPLPQYGFWFVRPGQMPVPVRLNVQTNNLERLEV